MSAYPSRQMIGALLVERGLISQEAFERALVEHNRTGEFLGTILTRLGILPSESLLPVLSEQTGLPYVRLASTQISPEILAKVPPKFASQYKLMPVGMAEGVLQVAMADPFDVQMLDELRLLLNQAVQPVLADPREIQDAIQRHYGVGASAVERLLDTGMHQAAPASRAEDLSAQHEAASVISFVNQLLVSAVKDRATDIHIEPFDQLLRVRQRIDGVMYEIPVPQDLIRLHQSIVSRIKVMAQLDIAERRLPQDGRIKVRLPGAAPGAEGQQLDLRISVLPTSFGETVEIRILSTQMLYSLGELGLAQDHLDILSKLIEKPHGIIFVTGPTGSGKSTTLYACLNKLNSPNVKILTIEDPVEYQLTGITQLQVHSKIGFTFAAGLRSMLRHDPDIMMVGEVRDPETAEITIRSALTGHLVFSTLHTNEAAGGITRLIDMGIEPFLVASSVLAFVAQRLVRLNCTACMEQRPADAGLREEFELTGEPPATIRYGRGCAACKGTGFKGRTAIHEVLLVSDPVQKLVLKQASSHEITDTARQFGKMRTLRQDGWLKVVQGLTTPQEVLRVT